MIAVASPQLSAHNNLPAVIEAQALPSLSSPLRQTSSSSITLRSKPANQQIERGRPHENLQISAAGSRRLIKSKTNLSQQTRQSPPRNHGEPTDNANSSGPQNRLHRANTDHGLRRQSLPAEGDPPEENWELRHGWEDQYNSSEYLGLLSSVRIEWRCVHRC